MDNLRTIKKRAEELLESVRNLEELEGVRVKLLGRKGELTIFLRSLKDIPLEERRQVGPAAQELKWALERSIRDRERSLKTERVKEALSKERLDITRPGARLPRGSVHPLVKVERQVVEIFSRMGFAVAEGPHIESEWYNFDALNMPPQHPARDMWNTFWLRSNQKIPNSKLQTPNKSQTPNSKPQNLLLRTHTSPVQVRYLEQNPPPLRIVVPGAVFRYEAIDATHNIQFQQLEGLLVDRQVSIANFKAVINDFFAEFFSSQVKKSSPPIRLRPSYFPFVEPGFEVDIFYNGQWLEMLGAGMVHPAVFKNAGLNPGDWQGFAFGLGIDRLAMVKYGINDIRLFYENDVRFLKQF